MSLRDQLSIWELRQAGVQYPEGMNIWARIIAVVTAVLLCSACSTLDGETSSQGETEDAPTHTSDNGTSAESAPTESSRAKETEETEQYSEASFDPESIHVLVNKHQGLQPTDFEPQDLRDLDVPQQFGGQQLREEAATALESLVAAAANEGVELWVTTAYRSFEHQQALYDQRVTEVGQDATDQLIARPGYTEHHTGLAVDMSFDGNQDCNLHACFAETQQGQWLAENAHHFGFIIRYPDGAQEITGYSYEPWHLRYVGEPTAIDVTSQDVTLEEYWKQPPAPDYNENDH